MNKQKPWFVFVIIFSLAFAEQTIADTLYQQQVNQAEPDDKQLQEALKQIKEHKEIKLQDKLSVAAFHKRSEPMKISKQPVCLSCHHALPHRKNERSRTFLNKHSHYIACESCHLRPKNVKLEYRWLAYDGVNAGREIAARSQQENKKEEDKLKQPLSLIPQTSARIVPFYQDRLALEFKGDEFANKAKADWKEANKEERAKIKARLHAPLEEKGPECQRCHGDEKPMLDLKTLGASPKQIKKIQRNTIVRYFTRFKKDDQRIRIKDLLK